jgi:hypothetical protein
MNGGLCWAAEHNYTEIVNYLHKNNCPINNAAARAIKENNIEID